MVNCTDHCSTCGQHFASIKAFDTHRTGRYTGRRCKTADKVKKLEASVGKCTLTGQTLKDVVVWSTK